MRAGAQKLCYLRGFQHCSLYAGFAAASIVVVHVPACFSDSLSLCLGADVPKVGTENIQCSSLDILVVVESLFSSTPTRALPNQKPHSRLVDTPPASLPSSPALLGLFSWYFGGS